MFSFIYGPASDIAANMEYSVRSKLDDIFDLWGGKFTFERDSVGTSFWMHIGQGYLFLGEIGEGSSRLAKNNEQAPIQLHYTNDRPSNGLLFDIPEPGNSVEIGTTVLNNNCTLSYELCRSYIANNSNLFHMGTRPPSWITTGRSGNIQVGAKGVVFEFGDIPDSRQREDEKGPT